MISVRRDFHRGRQCTHLGEQHGSSVALLQASVRRRTPREACEQCRGKKFEGVTKLASKKIYIDDNMCAGTAMEECASVNYDERLVIVMHGV
jgi:hypothetical protein